MNETGESKVRATTRGRPAAAGRRASAGLQAAGPGSDDDRLAELEARLARLESNPGLRERGRSVMARVMPPEASHHFRNAGREQLLGMRSIVDFWIRRIDALEAAEAMSHPDRETIEID
ncbi:MAG: hypothetical protein ACRDGL_08475 [Candidatus Limnocylindrales bacterium]